MAKAEVKKEKTKKPSLDNVEEKKEITLEETEDDIFGKTFKSNPEDFTEEIVREAQKTSVMGFLLPLFVFILIAGASAGATYYYAKPERSIESTSVKAEDKIQNAPVIAQPSDTPVVAPAAPVTQTPAPTTPQTTSKDINYTVKEGDTMSGIANKYDMTSAELAKYNGLSDVHSLKIGQVLKIPSK